jgi:HicB family
MAQTARSQRMHDGASAPDEETGHSGRLLLRMPQSLHSELVRTAEREGVSLNALITGILSGAVQWRSEDRAGRAGSESRGRFMRIVLIADLALVAIAAVAAIALLIAAA